jgi:hypothetical protein
MRYLSVLLRLALVVLCCACSERVALKVYSNATRAALQP